MYVNRSIKVEDGKLIITKNYAETNLSKAALSVAKEINNGTHYEWIWGQTSTAVLFEIPNVFKIASFIDLARELSMYCESYIAAAKLTDSTILKTFMENKKK